jgi:hypothetical protein
MLPEGYEGRQTRKAGFPKLNKSDKLVFYTSFSRLDQPKHYFLNMFLKFGQTRKCFLGVFPASGKAKKHCFLDMLRFPKLGKAEKMFTSHVY